jgi:hypothetical protein
LAEEIANVRMSKRQNGNVTGSEADISAALTIKPNVADELASYGIK